MKFNKTVNNYFFNHYNDNYNNKYLFILDYKQIYKFIN